MVHPVEQEERVSVCSCVVEAARRRKACAQPEGHRGGRLLGCRRVSAWRAEQHDWCGTSGQGTREP